jgi:hypothetical protein
VDRGIGVVGRKRKVSISIVRALTSGTVFAWRWDDRGRPKPPGQPSSGPGSPAGYICDSYALTQSGRIWDGTLATTFVPTRLKNGNKAPVVVFLHGFLMVAPKIYKDLIDHLVYQGNIVVCAEANVGSPLKLMSDTDQNVMMARAVGNAGKGLAMAGAKADMDNLYIIGHSLGGLLSLCWMGSGGPRPRAIVLMNPNTDPSSGMPGFVSGLVKITRIDWKARAAAVDVPAVILTGDQDTIAPPSQSCEIYDALVSAPSRAVYCAQGDARGNPAIKAEHNSSLCDDAFVPSFLMGFLGGAGKVDALDSRYYWAAIDQVMSGRTACTFDMGKWSDGVPVRPVK